VKALKQTKVLETLKKHPRSTSKQLAQHSGVKHGTVMSSLHAMIGRKHAYVADHLGPYKSARYVAGKATAGKCAKRPERLTGRTYVALGTDGSEAATLSLLPSGSLAIGVGTGRVVLDRATLGVLLGFAERVLGR
jgi:hypothetical protein